MNRYTSPIVRHVCEAIRGTIKGRGVMAACRDAGIFHQTLRDWETGRDPLLSNAEAALNARGLTLIIVPLDRPVEPLS